jgi:hypothetical protein
LSLCFLFLAELKKNLEVVPVVGVEPTRAQGPSDFESDVYANFTTPAGVLNMGAPAVRVQRFLPVVIS